jgi:hypothetical protein
MPRFVFLMINVLKSGIENPLEVATTLSPAGIYIKFSMV